MRELRDWMLSRPFASCAPVALAAFPFVYFWEITLGQKVWYGTDIIRLFHPLGVELGRALNEDRLPLWTPFLSAGFPLLAESQIAALYPPNWILFRFLPAHHALSYSMLLHLAWAAVGMYTCARALGVSPASAFLAGFVFSFNAFQISHLIHPPIIAAAAWLPWLIFLQMQCTRARQERSSRFAFHFSLLTFALAAQFLAGSIQIAFLNTLAWLVVGGALSLRAQSAEQSPGSNTEITLQKPRAITTVKSPLTIYRLPITLFLALGIAAAQLLPTAELVGYSVRSDVRVDFAASYALPPNYLAQFVAPFSQGEPSESNNEYWGYFSAGAFLLALAAPFLRRDRFAIFFALLALGALLLALGDAIPLVSFVHRLPVFSFFRVPARYLLLVVFAGALLAAFALDALAARLRRRALLNALALGVIVFDLSATAPPFTLSLAWMNTPAYVQAIVRALPMFDNGRVWADTSFFPSIPGMRNALYPNLASVYGKASAQIFSSLALVRNENYVYNLSPAMLNALHARAVTIPLESRPKSEPLTPPDNLFADIVTNPATLAPTTIYAIELAAFSDQTPELGDGFVAGELQVTFADGNARAFPLRMGIEIADWDHDRVAAMNQVAHRRASVARAFPAFTRAFGRAFDGYAYRARFELSAPREIVRLAVRSNLPPARLIVESVTLFDAPDRAVALATLAGKNDFRVAYFSDTVIVWENRDALPRAFIAENAEVLADDGAVMARMHSREWRPARTVLLSEGKALESRGAAQITREEPMRVQLAANADRAGYVVLADSWYPGWTARVDGRDAPVYRANLIFRAVPLESGEHSIEFVYEPLSFKIGAAVSAASLLATIFVAGLAQKNALGK